MINDDDINDDDVIDDIIVGGEGEGEQPTAPDDRVAGDGQEVVDGEQVVPDRGRTEDEQLATATAGNIKRSAAGDLKYRIRSINSRTQITRAGCVFEGF